MKIRCDCGGLIVDQTDELSFKGYLLADEDWHDLWKAIDCKIQAISSTDLDAKKRLSFEINNLVSQFHRSMYQCLKCGKLYVDDIDRKRRMHEFLPVQPTESLNILRSKEGDRWKKPLSGSWRSYRTDFPGELWWSGGDSDRGFEQFSDWDQLSNRYYEIFERLRSKNILRSAWLCKDEIVVHKWTA